MFSNNSLSNLIRVLIVEDNYTNRSMLLKQMKFMGCRVVAVENGKQAVEYCQNHHTDVVFMDCSMPIMDGYQATALIRQNAQRQRNSPVIIGLTARALPGDRQKCLAAGMDDYLAKPAFTKDLQAILDKWAQPAAV